MELEYSCPQCHARDRIPAAEDRTVLTCPRCDYVGLLPFDWSPGRQVEMCPICGCSDLFRQRDFHQKVCLLLLLAGATLALVTRFVSLFVAALVVVFLWLRAPERLVCYRCRSLIRGHLPSGRHGRYDARLDAESSHRTPPRSESSPQNLGER